jgi:hypothetical protein
MADSASLGAASIAIGQTVVAYQVFLPRLSEVRRADDEYMRSDVLLGQFAAGSVSVMVGFLLTQMSGSRTPLIVSLFLAVLIAAIYQYAMVRGTDASH